MPHKHSVTYIIENKKECELKKHKQFNLLYFSEDEQFRNRRIASLNNGGMVLTLGQYVHSSYRFMSRGDIFLKTMLAYV